MTNTQRDSRGRFLPGNKFGRGRAHGTRMLLGQNLIEALSADFAVHGVETVVTVREERPVDYLKICLSLLPKDHTLIIHPISDLTDDELHSKLHELNTALARDTGGKVGGDGGTGAAAEDHESQPLPALPPPK